MARSSRPDSAGSQFFIMVDDAPHLDGSYAAFGKVIEGIEEADRIVSVRRNLSDKAAGGSADGQSNGGNLWRRDRRTGNAVKKQRKMLGIVLAGKNDIFIVFSCFFLVQKPLFFIPKGNCKKAPAE